MKAYHSSSGAGNYQLMPYHLDPGNFCIFMNNDYKRYLAELYKVSNFPHVTDEYYCPLPKVRQVTSYWSRKERFLMLILSLQAVYKIKNYEFDGTKLPSSFRPGYYKVQMYFEMPNGDKSGLNIYAKISASL